MIINLQELNLRIWLIFLLRIKTADNMTKWQSESQEIKREKRFFIWIFVMVYFYSCFQEPIQLNSFLLISHINQLFIIFCLSIYNNCNFFRMLQMIMWSRSNWKISKKQSLVRIYCRVLFLDFSRSYLLCQFLLSLH